MPEFIQPETKTVGLGEKIEFNHSLEHSELKEKFIKMYEQDPNSAWLELITTIMSTGSPEEILKHYGIDGQKWGVRHGPPYPLSRQKDKKWSVKNENGSTQELSAKPRRLGKREKAMIVIENIDDLSAKELRELISRIEMEEKLYNMASGTKKNGNDTATKLINKFGETLITAAVPIGVGIAAREIEKAIKKAKAEK